MIKAAATRSTGRKVFLLGLSSRNLENLKAGKPMRIHLEEIGGTGEVIILWGETEAAIARDLAEFIGPDTSLKGAIPTSS